MAEKTLPIIAGNGESIPAPFLDKTLVVGKSGNGMDMYYDENGERYPLLRFPPGFTAFGDLGEISAGDNLGGKSVLEVLMDAIGQRCRIRVLAGVGIGGVAGGGDYKKGAEVTVAAILLTGTIFTGWRDDDTGEILSLESVWTFIASMDMNITATGTGGIVRP
jgi:hypothetical protein